MVVSDLFSGPGHRIGRHSAWGWGLGGEGDGAKDPSCLALLLECLGAGGGSLSCAEGCLASWVLGAFSGIPGKLALAGPGRQWG